nr:amidohydrolase family protein [Sinorhizobium meliloti]
MPGFIDTHTHLTQSLGKSLVFGEPSEIFRRIWVPLEGSLDERMVYLSAKLAALECLRGGFTAAVDAGTRSAGHINALIRAARQTGLRSVIGLICNDLGGAAVVPERTTIVKNAARHLAAFEGDPLVHASLAISIPEAATDLMLADVSRMAREAGEYSRPMSTNTSSPSSARWSQTAAARWSISPISAPSARMC